MLFSSTKRSNICKRLWIFVFCYKCGEKNIGKNISKNVSSKYSQKLIVYAKKSPKDALKTASKRVIQKTTEATGGLIRMKIAD